MFSYLHKIYVYFLMILFYLIFCFIIKCALVYIVVSFTYIQMKWFLIWKGWLKFFFLFVCHQSDFFFTCIFYICINQHMHTAYIQNGKMLWWCWCCEQRDVNFHNKLWICNETTTNILPWNNDSDNHSPIKVIWEHKIFPVKSIIQCLFEVSIY